jgi:AcrR family transcriptional regulator
MARPREFDLDEALDRALDVFWRHGYEGATIPDLTKAMGINRPSLYAAFGNKEQLFRKVLDRYRAGPAAYAAEALREPTARAVVEQLFERIVSQLGRRNHPRGCLLVQGALACGEEVESVQKELAACREEVVWAIRDRFKRGVKEGDLPAGTDCNALARYVVTVTNGLAVQSAGGASSPELRRVAEIALRAWPT